ncbi:hypothetical protein PFISCL1PPCAC_16139, partial [Pristionchus fissidentatus]
SSRSAMLTQSRMVGCRIGTKTERGGGSIAEGKRYRTHIINSYRKASGYLYDEHERMAYILCDKRGDALEVCRKENRSGFEEATVCKFTKSKHYNVLCSDA